MPRNSAPTVDLEPAPRARRLWRRVLQVALVVLLAANALFFAVLRKPAAQRTQGRRETFDQLRGELESRRTGLTKMRQIAANLSEAQKEDLDFYQQKFLPKPTGFSIIMEEVNKVAQANRVRKGAVSYTLADVRGRPDLNQVDITTMVEGEYANIVRFVNGVERSPLFLLIENISVAGGTPTPGQPHLVRLSLRLVTFFRV